MKKVQEVVQRVTLGSKKNAQKIYILADCKLDVIHRWLNSLGVYPCEVTDDAEFMRVTIATAKTRVLLIVVDSGAGLFSSAGQFAEMREIASLADKKLKKDVCFLYTSQKFKEDIDFSLGKNMSNWYPYTSTASILECINKYHSYHIKGQPCTECPTASEILESSIPQKTYIEKSYESIKGFQEARQILRTEAKIYDGKPLKKEKLADYNKINLPIYNVKI